ncbi:hypothetical protein WJX74_005535 [Apatococcus lobatus]|uniref:Uncharacterized protein n=1 Tax=Apatococcus lobatus TaxID=904363 RepID=A0AAW1RPV3_9CHLO
MRTHSKRSGRSWVTAGTASPEARYRQKSAVGPRQPVPCTTSSLLAAGDLSHLNIRRFGKREKFETELSNFKVKPRRMGVREDAVLAKDEAEKFLLKNAVICCYLNLNKKIANLYEWKYVVKPGAQCNGRHGTRRCEQSDEPLLVGQLLGSAEPWTPVYNIAEREALSFTQAAPPGLPNHQAPASGARASSSDAGQQSAKPQNASPKAPSIPQNLGSMSDSELKTEKEAAEAAVKKISAQLKGENESAERPSLSLAKQHLGMLQKRQWASSGLQLLSKPQFLNTERRMTEEVQRHLRGLGCRIDMTTDEIRETAKRTAKSDRACKAGLAQRHSCLNSVEQSRATLQEELNQCKQRSSGIYQEYLARI